MVLAAVCSAAAGAALPSKVHVGISASFVRSGGGALWVTDRTDNRVIRVDPVAGRVVERGTHHELLARRGYYYDLYQQQFAEMVPV